MSALFDRARVRFVCLELRLEIRQLAAPVEI
jgi:hypothetical protein